MIRFLFAALTAGLVVGCSADSRREPEPREMCRELALECPDLGSSRLDECASIGERGQRDPTQEDRCFVYYDSCIHECRFVREWEYEREAGVVEEAGADAGPQADASPGLVDDAAAD